MKRPPLLLAGVLFVVLITVSASAEAQTREISSFAPLQNRDVLTMVDRKYPAAAIITMIKSSPCHFDTFPPILQDLKFRGVPGEVLQAMVDAPYGPSTDSKDTDALGDGPIYHYAEQLKQMGVLNTIASGRRLNARQGRTRAARRRR